MRLAAQVQGNNCQNLQVRLGKPTRKFRIRRSNHFRTGLQVGWLAKNRFSDNAGCVKYFFSTQLHPLGEERHFALVDGFALCSTNQGSLVISFKSDISIRPMHLFGRMHDHDYYFGLLFAEERNANQLLGVRLHTMAISGLFHVRTELHNLLVIPSLAHHPK